MAILPIAYDAYMKTIEDIQQAAREYGQLLSDFLGQHHLERYAACAIDHIAIKLKDAADFERSLEALVALSTSASVAEINNRRLATAVLPEAIAVPGFGSSAILEIMEPRPGVVATTAGHIDHIELRVAGIGEVARVLEEQHVSFEVQNNGYHQAAVVVLNELGQEVKFTNSDLLAIVKEQDEKGTSQVLK